MKKEIIRVTDLCVKRESGCSLQHIHMHLYEGEVLGVIGLHDAGKSFLFDCLTGDCSVDCGNLYFQEERKNWGKWKRGTDIWRIKGTSALVDNRSVLENLFVIRKRRRFAVWIPWRKIRMQAEVCMKEFGIEVDCRKKVYELSLEERHEIEILKAYITGAKLILIDDVLTPYRIGDYQKLYNLICKMQKKGLSFIIAGRQMEKIQILTEKCMFMVNGWAVKTVTNTKRKQIDERFILMGLTPGRQEKERGEDVIFHKPAQDAKRSPLMTIRCDTPLSRFSSEISIGHGEIAVVLDINHRLEQYVQSILNKKGIERRLVKLDGKQWKGSKELNCIDFLHTKQVIPCLSLRDNLCFTSYSRISRFGFINPVKAGVIEKFFKEQYPNMSVEEHHLTHLSFESEMAIWLEQLKLQKWKVMFCFNLENVMSYEIEAMIKKQFLMMTEGRKSICIFASSLEKFAGFADYYLLEDESGMIRRYTYKELREYLKI